MFERSVRQFNVFFHSTLEPAVSTIDKRYGVDMNNCQSLTSFDQSKTLFFFSIRKWMKLRINFELKTLKNSNKFKLNSKLLVNENFHQFSFIFFCFLQQKTVEFYNLNCANQKNEMKISRQKNMRWKVR